MRIYVTSVLTIPIFLKLKSLIHLIFCKKNKSGLSSQIQSLVLGAEVGFLVPWGHIRRGRVFWYHWCIEYKCPTDWCLGFQGGVHDCWIPAELWDPCHGNGSWNATLWIPDRNVTVHRVILLFSFRLLDLLFIVHPPFPHLRAWGAGGSSVALHLRLSHCYHPIEGSGTDDLYSRQSRKNDCGFLDEGSEAIVMTFSILVSRDERSPLEILNRVTTSLTINHSAYNRILRFTNFPCRRWEIQSAIVCSVSTCTGTKYPSIVSNCNPRFDSFQLRRFTRRHGEFSISIRYPTRNCRYVRMRQSILSRLHELSGYIAVDIVLPTLKINRLSLTISRFSIIFTI